MSNDQNQPFIRDSSNGSIGGRNRNSMVANMSPPSTTVHSHGEQPLTPPNPPFSLGPSGRPQSGISLSSLASGKGDKQDNRSSLSINYLPSKFSRPHSPGISYRKANTKGVKRGGGRDAFADGASRMPGPNDTDYDGIAVDGWFQGGKGAPGLRPSLHWNRFKWVLLGTNTLLTLWTVGALVACLITWFNTWDHADIVRVGNEGELVVSTIAASVGILTALIGWAGILLNNRAFVSVYTLLCWITFALLVIPGYLSYKRFAFNLEGKVNSQWSRNLGVIGRLRIQNELKCCGYFSPFVEATVSQTCYARSTLPGCKGPYLKFQKYILQRWYIASFSIVPIQLGCIIAALLCGNHITYRFGKGMMPKRYRLNQESMAVIMDNYANQLADQYGEDVAQDVLARSRSNLALDNMSYVSHGGNRSSSWSSATATGPPGNSPYGQYGTVSGDRSGGHGSGSEDGGGHYGKPR